MHTPQTHTDSVASRISVSASRPWSRIGKLMVGLGAALSVLHGSASAQNVLDDFTHATNPDGDFGAGVSRSISGSGNVNINTIADEARLTADNLDTPSFSGLTYNFTPSQSVNSTVSILARNRQTSVTETGVVYITVTTSSGSHSLSQTLPGNTPTHQTYNFDFSSVLGASMSIQKLELAWDGPTGFSGLRGLAIDKIQLISPVPEPSSMALVFGLGSMGFVLGRRWVAGRRSS